MISSMEEVSKEWKGFGIEGIEMVFNGVNGGGGGAGNCLSCTGRRREDHELG